VIGSNDELVTTGDADTLEYFSIFKDFDLQSNGSVLQLRNGDELRETLNRVGTGGG